MATTSTTTEPATGSFRLVTRVSIDLAYDFERRHVGLATDATNRGGIVLGRLFRVLSSGVRFAYCY